MNCHCSDYLKLNKSELKVQIEEARKQLDIARQEEAYADNDLLDIAIEKVGIAMDNLNILYKLAKLV